VGEPAPAAGAAAPARPNPFRGARPRFLQVHNLYLLLEIDDGLLVVDQHALHERVVYERLRKEQRARRVEVQRLLAPTVVALTPAEKAWVLDAREQLAAAGPARPRFGAGAGPRDAGAAA